MPAKTKSPADRRKQNRIYALLGLLAVASLGVFLVVRAFESNILFFVTPSDLVDRELTGNEQFRLGGLVEEGTVVQDEETLKVEFSVTDGGASTLVVYVGLLPDLFREGQGVVAEGRINEEGVFEAHNILAKHDENYMPAEVEEALREQGHWMDEEEGYGETN